MASVSILEVRPDGFASMARKSNALLLISRAPDTAPARKGRVIHNGSNTKTPASRYQARVKLFDQIKA
jgi:hypothetical protein